MGTVIPLGPLQALRTACKQVEAGRVPDTAFRRQGAHLAELASESCIPLLMRALRSEAGYASEWASYLLRGLARKSTGKSDPLLCEIVRQLERLLAERTLPPRARVLGRALLGEFGPIQRLGAAPARSLARGAVQELMGSLDRAEDFRQAAELIVAQIAPPQMEAFCRELLLHGGNRAVRLACDILALAEPSVRALIEGQLVLLAGREQSPSTHASPSVSSWRARRRAHHVGPRRRGGEAALRRSLGLLERGEPAEALPLLRGYVRQHPSEPFGHSLLGICLLQAQRPGEALRHLELACKQEPTEPVHYFHLATAAHEAGRVGRCYLALRAYLMMQDPSADATERQAHAAAYASAYEQAGTTLHPGIDPLRLAQAEERFESALDLMRRGRLRRCARELEEVLRLVPSHRASWSNLGTVYTMLALPLEAERCFGRARELERPGGLREVAREP